MKKLLIAVVVLGLSAPGFAKKPEGKTETAAVPNAEAAFAPAAAEKKEDKAEKKADKKAEIAEKKAAKKAKQAEKKAGKAAKKAEKAQNETNPKADPHAGH
ncbi:MAG: hypothetical protein NDJ72_02015 [Elusimicrobia bacterium]|nr:hypothetical protein [Elusimicrobiota bacterium]